MAQHTAGEEDEGQIGDGSTDNSVAPDPVSIPSGLTVSSISAADYGACAVLSDSNTYCWGSNDHGQIGDGSTTDRTTPISVVNLPSETSQIACSAGTYQASTGQSSCDDADSGYYVDTTASTSQTACAAGTYQASTGQSSCDDADSGYYVDTTASTSQTACAAGTYQHPPASHPATTPTPATTPSTASTSQTACAAGTYQPDTAQSSCDDADSGYTSTASTSQTACAAGTYQPGHRTGSCDDADSGYYVDTTASTSQTACAQGHTSPTPHRPPATTPTPATTWDPPHRHPRPHALQGHTSPTPHRHPATMPIRVTTSMTRPRYPRPHARCRLLPALFRSVIMSESRRWILRRHHGKHIPDRVLIGDLPAS